MDFSNQQEQYAKKRKLVRVGKEYQACVPIFCSRKLPPEDYRNDVAVRVWSPYNKIPEDSLNEYLYHAKETYFYTNDQALCLLEWNKFDLQTSFADLPKYEPYGVELNDEEQALFEEANVQASKSKLSNKFGIIKQYLPHISIPDLITYYYIRNKNRSTHMEKIVKEIDIAKRRSRKNRSSSMSTNYIKEISNEENESYSNNTESLLEQNCDKKNTEDELITCCICNKELRSNGQNLIISCHDDNYCSVCFIGKRDKPIQITCETGDCYYHHLKDNTKRLLFAHDDVIQLISRGKDFADIWLKNLDLVLKNEMSKIQRSKQQLYLIDQKLKPYTDFINNLLLIKNSK